MRRPSPTVLSRTALCTWQKNTGSAWTMPMSVAWWRSTGALHRRWSPPFPATTAHGLDLSHKQDDMVPLLALDAWSRMALTDAQCMEVFDAVSQQHEVVCHALLP